MNESQADLWQRTQSVDLDVEGASFPFSQRLGRENGWSEEFAHRVVHEYRRFAFLAVNSDNGVSGRTR